MAKKIWNVTADLAESLCGVCPNCGGTLIHRRNYSLECEDCGNRINVETKTERHIMLGFSVAIMAFAAGGILMLTLAIL